MKGRWEEETKKKKEGAVILKSPLDVGLIIVCLVFAMAVIETLAVGVYIQLVGGLRVPGGRVLIKSPDHKLNKLVCASSPVSLFYIPGVCLFSIIFFACV